MPNQNTFLLKPLLQQQFILFSMIQDKLNELLNISYDVHKGIVLDWKFMNLFKQETYLRHLCLISCKQQSWIRSFLNQIYLEIKGGDYIGWADNHLSKNLPKIIWKEKTLEKDSRLKPSQFLQNAHFHRARILALAAQQSELLREPIAVNIFVDDHETYNSYRMEIQAGRKRGKFPFLVSFFGKILQNELSISTGINTFHLHEDNTTEMAAFYKSLVSQPTILSMRCQIESENGQLTSRNPLEWRNTKFNRIERCYYGPFYLYEADTIKITNEQASREAHYALSFELTLHMFNKELLRIRKHLTVNVPESKFYHQTVVQRPSNDQFEVSESIWLKKNPFKTDSQIIFHRKLSETFGD